MLSINEIKNYIEEQKGVTVDKIESFKYYGSTAYLVNENYRVAYEARENLTSTKANHKKRITGRKISKKEYNRIKEKFGAEIME